VWPNGDRNQVRLMAAVLIGGSLIFAACANAGAGGNPKSPPAPTTRARVLCQAVPHLDLLVVRRTDAFPQNHFRFSFPPVVTVSDPARVRDAGTALCALPKMPKGVFNCPADFGIDYHLTFSAAGRSFRTVIVDATGCQQVQGLGPTRWVARSPSFWQLLGEAMGLSNPTNATFSGTGGNG